MISILLSDIDLLYGLPGERTVKEVVVNRCSVKKVFLEFHKIHRKTPGPQAQVFPVNFVKFLRTRCYRTPLVAASQLLAIKFLANSTLYCRIVGKLPIFLIPCETNKKLNEWVNLFIRRFSPSKVYSVSLDINRKCTLAFM